MVVEDPIAIFPYDPAWPEVFRRIGGRLRSVLGTMALRIDHIGSTSVPGLDAKPVIDVQLSVAALVPELPYLRPLESLGYRWYRENPDRSKRFFREPEGEPRTHLHVREVGSFDEQLNLLLRDYLRTHPDAAAEYARVKWSLAEKFQNDRDGYVRAKEPTVWLLLSRAHDWAQATGWRPGPTDA
ncbi:MAG TPA: GrpB family protein [Thermoplasmata archaeon]|nr:GrpB family protein [Thermoplasmata archaeon]